MVFGCWVTIWNPFFLYLFFTIVATWAGFDFWAYWLDYTYFIPPSLQHARRFTKYPAGIYAAFAHTIIIISSQSLSPFPQPFALVFISYTLSIKYPYRPQASAAAAICLKQYHIPLNPFLSFVSLYIRRGNGVLGSWAEYDRPFLFVILGCLCLVDAQKGSTGRLLGDGQEDVIICVAYWRMYKRSLLRIYQS